MCIRDRYDALPMYWRLLSSTSVMVAPVKASPPMFCTRSLYRKICPGVYDGSSLHTSFHTHAAGAGAATTNDAHALIGANPGAVNHAQLVIVDPTTAVSGMVKLISKYRHWPGASEAPVAVTTFPTRFAVTPAETVPREIAVSEVGMVSVTVNEEIVVVPLLQMYTRYLPVHPGWPFV